jgi:signal transduction histidine kinase
LAWEIVRTHEPARRDDWSEVQNATATLVRDRLGVSSSVGAPIVVGDGLWGMIAVHSRRGSLPAGTERRLERFAALVATALTNAQARSEVRRLAEEQAALRRVATLVAQAPPPAAVFEAVTSEVAELLGASAVEMVRYAADMDRLTVVAHRGGTAPVQVGETFPPGGTDVTSTVVRTGQTARVDDVERASGPSGERAGGVGVESVVAAPVMVDRRIWGALVATWSDRGPAPDDTEERLSSFAELLGTAIANADSRDQLTASRARVLAAGDDARRRVVRDLHDGAQQRLVQSVLTLKIAQQALPEEPLKAEELVGDALRSAEGAMSEVRELAHGILPAVLIRGGLQAGVEALVSRLPVPVDVDVIGDRLPRDIEASAYFILAEALTNVVKHADATCAGVRAGIENGELTLTVRDDGIGGADPEGHGLVGIADRVEALGGRLRVDSNHGKGTELTARLPLRREPSA